ncbi:IclR family transcriptional regulator [Nocardioides albertanoniae]|uniref:IclR family transcriptional regulator n=1 Tax=Nocardioides albertanoniae TaxID=1175486 RepID=A0A543A313_9ACTN|nr:IclR family transcriptional regulator C-terminal domain-containing protein [Nocardioides albertanoniae]TQL66954.1 IclR family transcriptional regulator [Nocardioides albertanoniae]
MAEHVAVRGTAESSDRDVVQSLARGLAVVRTFDAGHPALSLDQAAERAGISRSAVRRLLLTLIEAGLVTFDGHLYRLTPRLLDLGYAQQSRLSLAEVAEPHCASLSSELGRTVSMATRDGAEAVYLVRVGAPRLMSISVHVGTRLPAHHLAIGRVQLAWLPEAELAGFLGSATFLDNPGRTPRTADELRAELAATRERGWCHVADELEAGLSAVAAPVRDRTGQVVGAVNVSSRSDGRPDVRDLLETVPDLLRTAESIGADVHHSHLW